MEDKGLRISEDTHTKLVDYIIKNPVFKMNKVADIAIKNWIDLDQEAKVISIIKHGEEKQA
jgi:hypothetical protein